MSVIKLTALAGTAAMALAGILSTAASAAPMTSSRPAVPQVLQYKVVNGHWLETASVKPSRINIRTGIRTVIKEYINHIRWTSTKPYSITGRGTVHYQNGSHHSAYVRVYNPDIGLGKHKYFGNMKVGGTKYAWDNVSGWHRV